VERDGGGKVGKRLTTVVIERLEPMLTNALI